MINSSGFGYGGARKRTAFTTLKIAVFAPMPMAKVNIATTVNAGDFISIRAANRMSCNSVPMTVLVGSPALMTQTFRLVVPRYRFGRKLIDGRNSPAARVLCGLVVTGFLIEIGQGKEQLRALFLAAYALAQGCLVGSDCGNDFVFPSQRVAQATLQPELQSVSVRFADRFQGTAKDGNCLVVLPLVQRDIAPRVFNNGFG